MKKKNLIILLLFPFLIATFCIVTINTTYNKIDVDISYIEWAYNDMEAFQISDVGYLLEAQGVNQRYYKVSGDGALVWFVENKDTSAEPCAEIIEKGGKYYLRALSEGEVIITCSNKKGNVYRQMTGVIYKDAAILLYPKISSSQNNIDSTVYYGEFDHRIGNAASIEMNVLVVPTSAAEQTQISCTDNISFDSASNVIRFNGTGKATLTVSVASGVAAPRSYSFQIVKDGVNVYNYDDLLYCTNRSEHGEIAVLRKSFESLYNAYILDESGKPVSSGDSYRTRYNNVECFGNYDKKTGKFSFADEIYSFTTTYNKRFIEQWNDFVKTDSRYSALSDQVRVGLRVQKDFYGNGYTINLHNLTYPYSNVLMVNDTGEVVRIPQMTSDNLFRGPLVLYSLGDPNNMPLVSLYGQDNVGMYVDGDGIVVNDVNLKNCEFGDRLENLATVGTVMEVSGNNVTVKNSRLSSGKSVMRSFSSSNLTVSNCLLSHGQNFLFVTGANEYVPVDEDVVASFWMLDGKVRTEAVGAFIKAGGDGDEVINDFLMEYCESDAEKQTMRKALRSIQAAINNAQSVKGQYKGSTNIVDCFFYQSGVASIGMESLFNSTFLETASPSTVSSLLSQYSIVPYTAKGVSGTSYPVKVNISGDTRFFDYKLTDSIEVGSMLEENLSAIAKEANLYDGEIDVDMVFPLRSLMIQNATHQGSVYTDSETGKKYVNIPVAFYGGGLNLSEVTFKGYEHMTDLSAPIEVDLLDTYLNLKGTGGELSLESAKGIIFKTVSTVTGFEPFSFRFVRGGCFWGETPRITELIANAKGV